GNKGDGLFAFARIRDANDGGFLDAREMIEHFFDLARVDVDAIDEKHVLLQVGNIKVAFLVLVTDVAGEQPAVGNSFGGFLRLPPIAEHDIAAPHTNFTGLTHAENFVIVVLHADFNVGN